jgi:hypothetical protein
VTRRDARDAARQHRRAGPQRAEAQAAAALLLARRAPAGGRPGPGAAGGRLPPLTQAQRPLLLPIGPAPVRWGTTSRFPLVGRLGELDNLKRHQRALDRPGPRAGDLRRRSIGPEWLVGGPVTCSSATRRRWAVTGRHLVTLTCHLGLRVGGRYVCGRGRGSHGVLRLLHART